jgi:putative methionine-R-sulfoxide reductase with GAF domain
MDPGTVSTTDPSLTAPRVERRRRFRHKLHSPVYASFKSPQAGVVVDLSELLDLSEDGFAVRTPEPLEADRPLALTLDLPETGVYLHGHGVAVWSDSSGRAGVRFSDLSDTSRRLLKEWLFTNVLVAAANHEARTEQRARTEQEQAVAPQPVEDRADSEEHLEAAEVIPASEALLPPVDAMREQIRDLAEDPDAALQLITSYACEWTGATGAALALVTGDELICRARSGETAPTLGVSVDVRHGLSGECVRTAQTVSAEDTETDPRVDVEVCRALGIGSILAMPIVSDYRVAGLLEVFAPAPHAFSQGHAALLRHLVEAVPLEQAMQHQPADLGVQEQSVETEAVSATAVAADEPPAAVETAPVPMTSAPAPEAIREPDEQLSERRATGSVPRSFYLLLMAAVAALATAAGYVLAPTIQSRWLAAANQSTSAAAAPQSGASRAALVTSPEDLRKLADSGDAEAQYWIGIRYGTGAKVEQNEGEAAKWFQRAAEQGHVQAQARLASYYWSGRGVPKDLSTAYFWAALAWAQGDENSKMLLEGLSSQMTRAQVLAARQQADDWLRLHNQARKPGSGL